MSDDEREQGGPKTTRPMPPPPRPPEEPPGDGPDLSPRYQFLDELGSGGHGVVYRVLDRQLEREVAMKTVHADRFSPAEGAVFLREARTAAALEHPNVVPIHDLGELPDGRPFYTMRHVSGRTLADALNDVGEGDGEWTLMRFIGVLQQLSRGLQAAHEHGLVHRDVKPANVLIGDLDEVLVVDWGIAKGMRGGPETTTGVVKGTVYYLAPEQLRGESATPASDLHSVGVVLYQMLTLELPYQADTSGEIIASILRDKPTDPEDVEGTPWPVPPELSALAVRLLAKDPGQRPKSAKEVADELRAFLEGVRERERRMSDAAELMEQGRAALDDHDRSRAALAGLEDEIKRLEDEHPPWQPVEEKLPLIDARAMCEEIGSKSWTSFLEGVNRYTDALVHVPDHAEVRAALADVFWERFTSAEEHREEALAETYRMLVERWHDGRYNRELEGHGRIELTVSPADAELVLHPLVERNLVLVDGPGESLGQGDVNQDEVPMGSYVIVATAPGHEPARYPVCIRRGETWKGELHLLKEGTLPEGFVYIPGAEVWLGGDEKATNSWPRRKVKIESFAIGRHPVTFGEWCEFLDAQAENGPPPDSLIPRVSGLGALCRTVGDRGYELNIGKLGNRADLTNSGWRAMPVVGLDRSAATWMAKWKSKELEQDVRLPSSHEWEFAARGVDERIYPWGRRFDAALCHSRDSLEGGADSLPVGRFRSDKSIYGAGDLAGSIQEWTSSWFNEERELADIRGGGWTSAASVARSAWRGVGHEETRNAQLGFRLTVRPVSEGTS